MQVHIQRIIFLVLSIWNKYRQTVFNTNTLAAAINAYETARKRRDKKDYKYGNDTFHGGLRGNLSTVLTWKCFVRRGSRIVSSYALGFDKRILNAINKGEISLDYENESCVTQNENLARLIKREDWLRTVRETQAHIKVYIDKTPSFPLVRDNDNFPKDSVLVSKEEIMFIRSLVNNFIGKKDNVLQYSLFNLWEGTKINKFNIHALFALPDKDNLWGKFYALQLEDLISSQPILLNINLDNIECMDENGNTYNLIPLEEALLQFSSKSANIEWRSSYKWKDLQTAKCDKNVPDNYKKEDEFSVFLSEFLCWNKQFSIDGKDVTDVTIISSGGPDVLLSFSGGTTQKLELEHEWRFYIQHGHCYNSAFRGCWIYANEPFEEEKIKKIFAPCLPDLKDNLPIMFLSSSGKKKKAYIADWDTMRFEEVSVK